MRYYRIDITDPASGKVQTYTSFFNGATDPGALNVELDIPVVPYAIPMGLAWVRVWGISLQSISQAQNLVGKGIKVYGGMQKGLPLANPQQSGLLVEGTIQQCYGNWQGVNMTLDVIIQPAAGNIEAPVNLTINWPAGQPMATALDATLATAYPTFTRSIDINAALVLPNTETGYYDSLLQFAQWVKNLSASIIGGTYRGVDILVKENAITVFDSTTQSDPKMIAFTDLIGQPTWIGAISQQFKAVMRADLKAGDFIKLPPNQAVTTPQSYSQYRQGSAFSGVWQIGQVRHVGNFRQPSADAWVTVVDCFQLPEQPAA